MSPVRVINENNEQLGVISLDEALRLSREAGLDLVEVSPTERPPVCRIMDYGKYKYDRKKRQKNASQAHTQDLKEIRIRPKTDAHDRSIKLNHARDFLGDGRKVQFTMLFRGRERFHKERAIEIFDDILAEFGETVKVDRRPIMEGRRMTMVISPVKPTSSKPPKKPKPENPPSAAAPTQVKEEAPATASATNQTTDASTMPQ